VAYGVVVLSPGVLEGAVEVGLLGEDGSVAIEGADDFGGGAERAVLVTLAGQCHPEHQGELCPCGDDLLPVLPLFAD